MKKRGQGLDVLYFLPIQSINQSTNSWLSTPNLLQNCHLNLAASQYSLDLSSSQLSCCCDISSSTIYFHFIFHFIFSIGLLDPSEYTRLKLLTLFSPINFFRTQGPRTFMCLSYNKLDPSPTNHQPTHQQRPTYTQHPNGRCITLRYLHMNHE